MDCGMIIALCERAQRMRLAQARQLLARHGLHIGQPAMLEYIRLHPGCSQKQIADNARITPASVAASVKRLEKGGLIVRRGDTADTRCNRVYLTALGESEGSACTAALCALENAALEALSQEERAVFAVCLQKICEHYGKAGEKRAESD